jgi:hypothetical protein
MTPWKLSNYWRIFVFIITFVITSMRRVQCNSRPFIFAAWVCLSISFFCNHQPFYLFKSSMSSRLWCTCFAHGLVHSTLLLCLVFFSNMPLINVYWLLCKDYMADHFATLIWKIVLSFLQTKTNLLHMQKLLLR